MDKMISRCVLKCSKCGNEFPFGVDVAGIDKLLCTCGNIDIINHYCKNCGRQINIMGKKRTRIINGKYNGADYICEHCGFNDGY